MYIGGSIGGGLLRGIYSVRAVIFDGSAWGGDQRGFERVYHFPVGCSSGASIRDGIVVFIELFFMINGSRTHGSFM